MRKDFRAWARFFRLAFWGGRMAWKTAWDMKRIDVSK